MVEIDTQVITKQCVGCGADIETPSALVFVPAICPPCMEQRRIEAEAEDARKARRMAVEAWERLCPPLYRGDDPAKRRIAPQEFARIVAWQPGPKGMGVAGATSGVGKTHTMFLLLHRLHFAGHKILATTAKRYEHWCHRMFEKDDDARANLDRARRVEILFIDDIGKEKYTERVESEFYDLIEHRTSHNRPILWTANATGEQLVRMMGEDRGAPIVRRLREFSEVISV